MVIGGDSCREVVSLNPSAAYYMNYFLHCFVLKMYGCLKSSKMYKKEAGIAH